MSPRRALAVLLGLAAALLGLSSSCATASSGDARTVSLTNKMWTCSGPVDLDSVSVTMNPDAVVTRFTRDAIHLQPGCTGRIGKIEVITSVADGVKIAAGVHDLTIGGGSIRCLAKLPTLHQDGVQVLGGDRITMHGLSIDCGRPGDSLINSNLFINMAGIATSPPTDVVCDACSFGGGAAHTVSVQNSIRSGVENSMICRAKYPALTLAIGSLAVDPVNVGNTLKDCAGSGGGGGGSGGSAGAKLAFRAAQTSVVYGKPVLLTGGFGKPKNGRQVIISARPFGRTSFTSVRTLRTDTDGSWKLRVRPVIQTSYRAVSRSATAPTITVHVRPQLIVSRRPGRLLVHVIGKPSSFRGRNVTLQVHRAGWTTLQRARLDTVGRATFTGVRPGLRVRAVVGAAPGYLGAASTSVTVR